MGSESAFRIHTRVTGSLFFRGDDVSLTVEGRGKPTPTLEIVDGGGRVRRALALRGRGKQRFHLGKLPTDFYVARLVQPWGEVAKTNFGVIPRRRIPGDPEANDLGVWSKCGLRYQRIDCCADQALTGAPGVVQWEDNSHFADGRQGWSCGGDLRTYPLLFQAIRAVGLEPLPIVETKSGNWEIGAIGTPRLIPIHEHLDEYRQFVYEAVKVAQLTVVECWNEPEFYWNLGDAVPCRHGRFREYMPMEAYVRTLRACHEGAKRANPKCQVVLGASLHQGQFSENVYRFGGAPWFDILGFHYFAGNSPYDFGYQVHYLREIMRRHGESKPIWDTEWGCGGAQPWDALVGGETFQAAFATKYIALAAMHGTVPAGHFDPVTGPHGPLPRAVALAVITHLLDGASFVGRLDLGRDNAGLLFRRRNGSVCGVFWARHRLRAVLRTTASWITTGSIFGAATRTPTADGRVKLELNEIPVLLDGLGEVEIVDGPYDTEEYRVIQDVSRVPVSRVTDELPAPFPRVDPGAIAVDGDLGDWKGIPLLGRPTRDDGTGYHPEYYKFDGYRPLDGRSRAAWDDHHLYVAAVVQKDPRAQINPDVANVFFVLRGFDWGTSWSDFSKGQSLLTLMSRPGGPNVVQSNGFDMSIAERELTEARIAVRVGKKKIVFEAAIPWSAFRPIQPVPGKTVQFLVFYGGDDGNDYYWWYRMLGTHWYVRPPAQTVELRF